MKKCESCGKLIPVGASFCPDCGAKAGSYPTEERRVAPAPQATPARPAEPSAKAAKPAAPHKKKKRLRVKPGTLLIAAVLLLALVLTVVLLTAKSCAKQPVAPALDAAAFAGDASPAPDEEAAAQAAPAVMPDVTNASEAEALAALEALGVPVRTEAGVFDPNEPVGNVRTQSPAAGSTLMPGELATLTVNATPLTFKVLQYAPRKARVTLGNLVAVCGAMDTTNPQYSYSIRFRFPEEFVLSGAFRCLSGAGETAPVKLSGKAALIREGKNIGSIESVVAGNDYLTWELEIGDWTGFYFDEVEYYEVTVTSKADETQTVTRLYTPEDVRTIQLVSTSFPGGRIEVDTPDAHSLTLRLTDDALQNGYTNSETPGSLPPVWNVKICEGSYRWLSATLDGTHGEPLDGMTLRVEQLYRAEKNPSDKTPATVENASYSVVNGAFVITVPLPEDAAQDVYALRWIDVSLADGKTEARIKLLE